MSLNSFVSNQGTQTPILTDNTGGTLSGTVIAVQKVDISGQGTAGTLWNGGVTGTINSGSIVVTQGTNNDTIIGGTLGSIIGIGSVSGLSNLPGGTLGSVVGVGGTTSVSVVNGTVSINELSGTLNLGTSVISSGTQQLLGTLNTLGTLPNLPQGSINVTAGTIATLGTLGTVGLLVNGTLATSGSATGMGTLTNVGSVTNIGQIYNAGTLQAGTLTTIPNIPGGTLGLVTTVTNLSNGTIQNSGTVTGVGVVSTVSGGSIIVTTGTILSSGTTTGVGSVSNIGSIAMLNAGTISTLPNLPQGSINVTAGTFIGTVQNNPVPTSKVTTYGTQGTAGAGTTFGTIQGTVGSGTEIIITAWSIVAIAGTPTASLGFGTQALPFQGTGVLAGGAFPAGGGITNALDTAVNSGTNGILVYGITGGTAFFTANYQVVATTV